MSTQTLNLSLPSQLVQLVDEEVRKNFTNRSEYIRSALIDKIRRGTAEESLEELFARSNALGRSLGFTTEQSVYDEIDRED